MVSGKALGVGPAPPAAGNSVVRVLSSERFLLLLAGGLLLILVGYPLFWLLFRSVGGPQTFTLKYYAEMFTNPGLLEPLVNTLLLAVLVGVGSCTVAVPLAWAVARTDLPLKGLINVVVAVSFMIPPYLTSVAYTMLLGPKAGVINEFWRNLTGLEEPLFNIFSMGGVVLVIAANAYAYVYLFVLAALRSIDPGLEMSARLLGAGTFSTTLRITLPMALPAISSGFLLAALNATALFGPQAFIGLPAQIYFLPTLIFTKLGRYPPEFASAAAMCSLLIVLMFTGLLVQKRLLGKRSYVSISGKAAAQRPLPLGSWKWLFLGLAAVIGLISFGIPFTTMLFFSFSKSWVGPVNLANFTLDNYTYVLFKDPVTRRSIVNTLTFATLAATGAVLLGALVAYIVQRSKLRGRQALDFLASMPLGLPGNVLAVGMILAFGRPPFLLYGTAWILPLAYVIRFLPSAERAGIGALQQVDTSLELAARVSGASWFTAFRRVVVPLLGPSLMAAWLLIFINSIGELSASVLLYSAGAEVASVAIFRLNEQGSTEAIAAFAVLMVVFALSLLVLASRIARRARGGKAESGDGAISLFLGG